MAPMKLGVVSEQSTGALYWIEFEAGRVAEDELYIW